MGTIFQRPQVTPSETTSTPNNSLLYCHEVSRANFKFIRQIWTSGPHQESIWWLALNQSNPNQKFYVRQTSKAKVYNHKRVDVILQQMKIMTTSTIQNIVMVHFAFQDQDFLYLVTEPLDSIPFQQLLKEHTFSEDQTKYVAMVLLGILDQVHDRGFALTELCPSNIHFDRKTGQLKLMEMACPTRIDQFCQCNQVSTPSPYSAPEILFRGKVQAECDFYSLGVIMYEMMTQEKLFQRIPFDRDAILKENLQVEKSKIPEEWEPEAADFLIKVLLKNPTLRLGRYGSFELKNHPWLKEYDTDDHYKNRVNLQNYCQKLKEQGTKDRVKQLSQEVSGKMLKKYDFQQAFDEYSFGQGVVRDKQHSMKEGIFKNNSSVFMKESRTMLNQNLTE